jgi:hypothetical protein
VVPARLDLGDLARRRELEFCLVHATHAHPVETLRIRRGPATFLAMNHQPNGRGRDRFAEQVHHTPLHQSVLGTQRAEPEEQAACNQ